MRTVYLDNNATTPIAPEVAEVMLPYLRENYFNPSSMYDAARPAADAIAHARRSVAEILGAGNPRQVVFTSCATESNNAAIFGAALAKPARRHVVTSSVEHPAVLEVCKELARRGYEVSFLPVNTRGEIEVRDFVRALRKDTLLVTIMHANNETGVMFPVEELARITKDTDPSILFHTDATQSVGKIPIDLSGAMGYVDMLSLSGHKLHAPKGVGALFLRRGTACRPFLLGGHQEEGRRAGTENVPHIVALGKACEIAMASMEEEHAVQRRRDRLQAALIERIPYLAVNGDGAARLPNTVNVACHYIEGEGILYQLSANGICASSGSACTSGSLEPSHVLKAMHVPFTAIHGSVRFSLSRYNTDEDVDHVIEVFPQIVHNLRRLSPYWDSERGVPRPA
jgi:cysteine desulfurase